MECKKPNIWDYKKASPRSPFNLRLLLITYNAVTLSEGGREENLIQAVTFLIPQVFPPVFVMITTSIFQSYSSKDVSRKDISALHIALGGLSLHPFLHLILYENKVKTCQKNVLRETKRWTLFEWISARKCSQGRLNFSVSF